MENMSGETERFFSVELRSRANLKNVTMTNGSRDGALVEGTIGELVRAAFVEGLILEIVGTRGTLRINLKDDEIERAIFSERNSDREQIEK